MADTVDTELPIAPVQDHGLRRQRQRWLLSLAASASGRRRLASACVVAAGWLLLPQAWAMASLLQGVLVDGHSPARWSACFAVLAATLLLRALLGRLAQDAAGDVAEAAKRELRARLYAILQAHGPRWLRTRRSGALGELPLAHVEALEGYCAGYLPARTEVAWVPPALLLAIFAVDWLPALVLLLAAPLVPLFMMLVGLGAEAASRGQLAELARMGGHFADRLKGLGLIRLYGRGEAELAGIVEAAEGVRERTLRVLRIAFLSSTVLEFFASLSVAAVALYFGLGYLGLLGDGPRPDLRTGLFCLLLAPEFFAPMRRLATHYHDRAGALAAAAEIEAMLGALPDATGAGVLPAAGPGGSMEPEAADGGVADHARAGDGRGGMHDDGEATGASGTGAPGAHSALPASAAGPGRMTAAAPLLRVERLALRAATDAPLLFADLSFALGTGERLAVTGPSGCGKSTLLEAIAGWLPPAQGRIAMAPGLEPAHAGQRPYLFQGSLADNLRLAWPQADAAALQAAARTAQVMRFAAGLPQGLDTVVGERGFGLSGGEARRVGLARALLRDPRLLLLDEPTAFLDPGTEAALLEALSAYAAGRAVLVATHSPVVMRWAGRVLELPGGVLRDAEGMPP
ncbi:thiol reductant ABC exporter subunit CydD [Pseudoxanthomonas broegbernensis]|uniref:Thiol reductant ABC exporter subunit CydD n=1 Tax=Pseudoxanthomonas broegbernensis TaxID=83619 RepID=A0A7V8K7U1_9GAMM|nr:ATP-binding cassette domain-containing protein [Pseudoxanthomonas broegbernensis]KAF1687602.1 thiol reductant ABC exporter subunit CydD [Pseudoxanthomonas broegbernensis]MBB6064624.1 ATP-binding cassette subfamily C protein CydD [Pseudoxanthomonas broegbernensis]